MQSVAFPLRRTEAVDPVGWLAAERPVLLELLATLTPSECAVPTECPAWSVLDIALHVLGDDLSLLSRQRDRAPSGVMALVDEDPSAGIPELINRFNERWVAAARFMSPGLVTELLQLTAGWTLEWYAHLDPTELGEPVWWAAPEPAPYWLIAAREYLERWTHQQQIARAVGRQGPDDERFVTAAAAVTMCSFLPALRAVPDDGAAVTFAISGPTGSSWTLAPNDSGWTLCEGAVDGAAAALSIDVAAASSLLSCALDEAEIRRNVRATGRDDLVARVLGTLVAFCSNGGPPEPP